MERAEELKQQVRETLLSERLVEARSRIGKMCSEGRPPRMTIPVQYDDDDFYISTTLSDAQATIADLQGQLLEWKRALHSLTPGGSEYANDSKACVEWVREARSRQHEAIIDGVKQRNALQQRVANLQGQLEVEREENRKVHATCDMLGRERNAADEAVYSLKQRVAQLEALLDTHKTEYRAVLQSKAKEIDEIQADCVKLRDRAAQLEGENKALVDAHRDFKVHLSHCNFGEHAQVCKYGREETCPALMPSWVWFGNALQRSEALQADHASCARVLGLERFTERERVRYRLALVSIATSTCCGPCEEAKKVARAALDEDIQTMEQYRAASLPAQRAKLAQGGAVSKPVTTCNRHSDCDAADEKARAKGALNADHCHDDCCSECFGN